MLMDPIVIISRKGGRGTGTKQMGQKSRPDTMIVKERAVRQQPQNANNNSSNNQRANSPLVIQ